MNYKNMDKYYRAIIKKYLNCNLTEIEKQ